MKNMEELKEMLCDELEEITSKGKITAGDLDAVDKLTHSIKSIETIMAMSGYSNDTDRTIDGRYSRGYSRRGYSRNDGYSYGRGDMIEDLRGLMEEAETEKEREAIRRCINQMK